jgi:hypothetical protein
MTDRINSITLVLAEDIRIDDAEALIAAAKQFRGVIAVTPNVSDINTLIGTQRAFSDLRGKIADVLWPKG